METGLELSADAFQDHSKRFGEKVKQWLETEKHAQTNRHQDPALMDIYDTVTKKSADGMENESSDLLYSDDYIQHHLVQQSTSS